MKSRAKLSPVFLALALGLATAPLSAAPVIPNPSFEANPVPTNFPGYIVGNTPIVGWITNDPTRCGLNPGTNFGPFADNGTIPNGARVAFLQSTGSTTTLSTTITGLTAGTWYRVQFSANCRTQVIAPRASYQVNGLPAVAFAVPFGGSHPYTTVNAIFRATATTAPLVISNTSAGDSTLLLDNFTISAATPIVVTTAADNVAGSLRTALTTAAGTPAFNVITFAAGLNGATLTLTAGEIVILDASGVAIDASALASSGITISGGNTSRIFNVGSSGLLALRSLTLTEGNGNGGNGGALYNVGTTAITACTFTANNAPSPFQSQGGAVDSEGGTMTLTSCTLSGNSVSRSIGTGGGITNGIGSTMTVSHCTLSGNQAQNGDGITNTGTLTLNNSIVASHMETYASDVFHVSGHLTYSGANIVREVYNPSGTISGPPPINADPGLSALASNGGPTQTMAIASSSPARNAAGGSTITTDQRGFPVVGTADIGAFEVQAGGTFSLDDDIYLANEGGAAEIVVQRSGNLTGTCSVRLVTTPGTAGAADFVGRPNTSVSDVTFLDGETAKTVRINILADSTTEGEETFTIKLSNPSPGATLDAPAMIAGSVKIRDAFLVTNRNDTGTGSLRQALTDAASHAGPDAVAFASSLSGQTITFGSEIIVTDTGGVTVDATSIGGLTISGNNATRLFRVSSAGVLNLTRLILTQGNGNGAANDGSGGAVLMNVGTIVTVTDCMFSANSASYGGAIMNSDPSVGYGGTLTLRRCTFFGNTASNRGGAVYSYTPTNEGTIRTHLDHCTLSGNTATVEHGGGLANINGTTTLVHCTLTGNTAPVGKGSGIASWGDSATETIVEKSIVAGNPNSDVDIVVTSSDNSFTSAGSNVIGTGNATGDFIQSGDVTNSTPLLAALANNGGPTMTHALLPGSPALDRAAGSISTADQRGVSIFGVADSGAFEVGTGGGFGMTGSGHVYVGEGQPLTVTINRSRDFKGPASVRLFTTNLTATGGVDFAARPDTTSSDVLFADGETSKTVLIPTTSDNVSEPANETLKLRLGSPLSPATIHGLSDVLVTIVDPIVVTTTTDDGPGSLRQAFRTAAANSLPDRITFAPALSGQTITLGGEIAVNDAGGVTVDGSALPKSITIDGAGYTRLFYIGSASATPFAMRGLTLTGGNAVGTMNPANNGDGGAVWMSSGLVTMTLERCTFHGNRAAGNGGAVWGGEDAMLTQCTFFDNACGDSAGAYFAGGAAKFVQCTLTGNSAGDTGGGLRSMAGLTLDRSIVSGNSATSTLASADLWTNLDIEVFGTSFVPVWQGFGTSGAGSINATTIALSPLADNGGPTKTCALPAGSPALNAGVGSTITSDQRGFRIVDAPDVGAFETQLGGTFAFGSTAFGDAGEGGIATITIKRIGGSEGTASVRVFTQNGTASATDFTARPDSAASDVLFGDGQDTATISISTTSDSLVEVNETVLLKLGSPSVGTALGSPATATLVIIDPSTNLGDSTNPALPVVTSPAPNGEIGVDVGGTIQITGTATDNKSVYGVNVSLAGPVGAPPPPAVGSVLVSDLAPSTVWKATVTPMTGVNSFTVQSFDPTLHASPVTAVRTFKVLRPLLVNVSGTGSVMPAGFTPKSYREVGKPYSLTAVSGVGAMFVGWSIISSHTPAQIGLSATDLQLPVINFIHREGLALRAAFATSPYTAQLTGIYNGAIKPNATLPTPSALDTEGFATFTLQSNGSFTGNFKLDGGTLPPVSGIFDASGIARFGPTRSQIFVVSRPNKPAITVTLQIDITPPLSGQITGLLSILDGTTRACDIVADRAVYSATNPVPSSFLNTANADAVYTLVFVPKSNVGFTTDQYPQGIGVGYYKLSKTGALTLAGTLADGTPITGSSTLSGANTWRLFVPLYGNKGLLAGNVSLITGNAFIDIEGNDTVWIRPILDMQHYPGGWPTGIVVDTAGAKLNVPPAASIVPGLPVGGAASVRFEQGLLPSLTSRTTTISATDIATNTSSDPGFTLKIDRKTGLFTGTFTHTDGSKLNYQGAVLNKVSNNACFGFFLSTTPKVKDYTGQSGPVELKR